MLRKLNYGAAREGQKKTKANKQRKRRRCLDGVVNDMEDVVIDLNDVVNDILHVVNDVVTPRNDIVNDIGTGRYDLQSMSYDVVNDMAMSITTSSGMGTTSL